MYLQRDQIKEHVNSYIVHRKSLGMTNFIFKSHKRLIKNSPINSDILMHQLTIVQGQNRHLRQDLVDVKLMLNKLLIDKHLQMQVDTYFDEDNNQSHPEDSQDID